MTAKDTKQNTNGGPELTVAECAALSKYSTRSKEKPSFRYTVSNKDGKSKLIFSSASGELARALHMQALGSADQEFVSGLIQQLAYAARHGMEIDESQFNFLLSVVNGIEPRDQLEAMLAAQMAVIHVRSMSLAGYQLENIPQQDSWERALNKLVRTFTIQMDALTRYRARAQQKVTTEDASESAESQPSAESIGQGITDGRDEKVGTLMAKSANETNVVAITRPNRRKERTALPPGRKPAA